MVSSKVGATTLVVLTAGLAAVMGPVGASSARVADPCATPLPQGSEPVTLDPANFVDTIDNAYWPMAPGSRWVYQETDAKGHIQKVLVRVTDRTKSVVGVDATVVRDTVTGKGSLVEDTRDWYAQDVCGNVWYLGENTKEYEDGQVVSTEGSWETGVDGAQAGIAVPGAPTAGLTYRQEYYAGHAEDGATVLSIDEQVRVPYGHFTDVLVTKDYTTLHPRILEYKFYAKGVGPVEEIGLSGGSDRAELVSYDAG